MFSSPRVALTTLALVSSAFGLAAGCGNDDSSEGGSAGEGGAAAGGTSSGGAGGDGSADPQRCVFPAGANSAAAATAYETFKTVTVTADGTERVGLPAMGGASMGGAASSEVEALRVWKPDSGSVIGSTVSEGMGYGMLLAVYHDDQEVFDAQWRYVEHYLNANGLMDWEVDPEGEVIGFGAASDGDEDIAFALVMADRKWGGAGGLERDYLELAQDMINAMFEHEVDWRRDDMWLPGDAWAGRDVHNISYFAPAYFRVFGEVTDNVEGWQSVIDRNYDILELTLREEDGNQDNGLVPAWSTSTGLPWPAYAGAPVHFQNDSTRTPFRIGQDWCWHGEPRAKAYLEKIAGFYAGEGVDQIVDGYDLDGTPRSERPEREEQAASFVGPAGVAFMSDSMYQAELNQAWDLVATEELTNGTIYYQKSWTALSLLMMAGDMVIYPAQ